MTVTSQPRDGARLASKEERAARAKKGKKDDRPEQFYITHGLRNEPPGSERWQAVRTRTTVSQAHSYHWLGSVGNRGNGQYRVELRQVLSAITLYLTAHRLDPSRALLCLDGQYGLGAVLADLAGFAFVTRGKEYSVLDHPLVQARLHLPPDQVQQR
ncbi:MAG: hypothetical protein M3Z24_14995, partial [Chloroflexota bacterium]|nr:hypothetical protein [Chloroflexota bacterium]